MCISRDLQVHSDPGDAINAAMFDLSGFEKKIALTS
jgi:hypothetical protein